MGALLLYSLANQVAFALAYWYSSGGELCEAICHDANVQNQQSYHKL